MEKERIKLSSQITPNSLEHKTVWNVKELCRYTGWSKSKIYQMTKENSIPHYKPTKGTLFFHSPEVIEWILAIKVEKNHEELNELIKSL